MDCRMVRKHLSAFEDGELEPSPMLEVEDHLHGCTGCADEQHFPGALKLGVKTQLAPVAAPAHLRKRVEDALRNVPMESDERPASHVWMTLATVAASVVLVLGSLI